MIVPSQAHLIRWGDFFFRWRSYLPMALLPVGVLAIARFQYPFGSHAADLAWEVASMLLALGGLALRVWTVGVAAPGTSGRNTREQKAAVLNTTGPYSLIRHPLYLANVTIATALSLFPHAWLAPLVVVPLIIGYYACIARREEAYLREKFGSEFDDWAARVPGFWPTFRAYQAAARPLQWKVAARREFYGLTLVLTAPFGLEVIEGLFETGTVHLDPVWGMSAVVGLVVFGVLRRLKKQTSLLATPRAPAAGGDSGAPAAMS
jgi:protein-S-isoprenylcysteine O-methyltransferase Ste14